MHLIKLALISLVGFFVLIMGISLLIPGHVRVSRAINIAVPKTRVLAQVSNLQQWSQWNLMVADSGLTHTKALDSVFVADQLQVRRIATWPDSVHLVWKQGKNNIPGGFNLYESGNVTAVQWYFDFYLRWYPWEKFGSLVFDKQLGPNMEKSLTNLQKVLEKNP